MRFKHGSTLYAAAAALLLMSAATGAASPKGPAMIHTTVLLPQTRQRGRKISRP